MNTAALSRDALIPRNPDSVGRGLAMALAVHALLLIAIAFGVSWRSSNPAGVEAQVHLPSFGFRMSTELGTLITETSTWHHGIEIPTVAQGNGYIDLSISELNLTAGRFALTLAITGMGNHVFDWIDNGFVLDVEPSSVYGSSITIDSRYGTNFFRQKWDLSGMQLAGITT